MDKGDPFVVLYLDFQKAFDTVPHQKLCQKLHQYGIRGNILGWIRSFLVGRTQKVRVGLAKSEATSVKSGVPQGSVLGPVLFLFYVNDLPERCISLMLMFADDTKVTRAITSYSEYSVLQNDIDNLHDWSQEWQLKFNKDKCKVLHLGTNNQEYKYVFNDPASSPFTIRTSTAEKDLGVVVDNKLSFDQHINQAVNKANRLVGIIFRTFKDLGKDTFLPLYKTLVRPILEYASPVWNPWKIAHKKLLEGVQRRATKRVQGLKDLTYTDRLKYLGLPTLEYRRLRQDMITVFKLVHGLEDISPDDLLSLDHNTRTRGHSFKLAKEHTKLYRTRQFFRHRVVTTWNSLPSDVADSPSINAFKTNINNHWKNHPSKFNPPF